MEQSDFDLLQSAPSYQLQAIVKTRGVLSTAKAQQGESGPAALVDTARALFDPSSLQQVLTSLDDLDVAIVRELIICGGRANSRDLALYFSSAGLLDSAKAAADQPSSSPSFETMHAYLTAPQYPTPHPHGPFEQALRRLLLLGLLFWGKQTNFSGRDYASGIHDGVLIVPPIVQTVALQLWGQEKDLRSLPSDSEVGEGAATLQRTLYLYWSMASTMREGLPLVANGLLSRPALRHVLEHMLNKKLTEPIRQESDFPHLLFVRLLLLKLGLLRTHKNILYTAPAEEFFALPLSERARRCYHLYLETPFWNEMLSLADVNIRPGPSPLEPAHEEVMRARHIVLDRLFHEQPATWWTLPAFIARCKLHAPYLLFPRQYGPRAERYSSGSNPYGWDFRLRRGWLTHREGWHMIEGGFIRAMITGPLHWLGLVNLDQEERPASFSLTPGAASIASTTPLTGEPLPWGRLIVQPNFELVALAPVSEALLIRLDRFAERISLEHIAQYRLTRASVTRAVQLGLRAEQIQAELTRAAGGDIPQNVSYSLSEWERQARRVEIWPTAVLLETDDPATLDTLMTDPGVRALFKRRLTPTLVEVMPHHLSAIQKLLWQRHYLPSLTSAPTENGASANGHLVTREPQWHLQPNGLLQPLYPVTDLYLAAELAHFTETDSTTSYPRLTASSIQHALTHDLHLDYILRFLQHYTDTGIPGSLLIRLKLWGGGYQNNPILAIERAPLLRLPNQILQDLQHDEDLQPLLGSALDPSSRLVHFDEINLPLLLSLLRDRGFTLE